MMEWIIAILVVVIVLMAAYIRGQWTVRDKLNKQNTELCKELDAADRHKYQLNDKLEHVQEGVNSVAKIIADRLSPDLNDIIVGRCGQSDASYILSHRLIDALDESIQRIQEEAAAGNRGELVKKLKDLYDAIGLQYTSFDEFMLELETIPSATYNRIAVHVLRQQK